MKVRLEKQNRKTVDFVELETKEHLLVVKAGKIGQSESNSTKHCGTQEKAIDELNKLVVHYQSKKFQIVETSEVDEFDGVYDKAKWHFRGDFPKELQDFQGFVHTGMYLTWLIDNNLFLIGSDPGFSEGVNNVLKREMTGPQFYQQYLDGVFTSEELTNMGNKFSRLYFDFDNGEFTNDYDELLCKDLPTIYHVEDNWDNYSKLSKRISKRFDEWQSD
jgi:predicted DNA-binding WGR domain protein